jgi:hypothetical protein
VNTTCPPPGIEACPSSQKAQNCENVPGVFPLKRFYQHVCNALFLPLPMFAAQLTCVKDPQANGDYDCYFLQTDPAGQPGA